MLRNLFRHVFIVSIAMAGLPGLVAAGQPFSTGLGQAWPHATDVSLSSHYHVYVFHRDGIRYIQVNDASGVVRGAVAAANDVVLVLPMGVDATRVKTLQVAAANAPAPSATPPGTEIVYKDQALTIAVTPQSTSATQITTVQSTCTDPGECSNNGP